MPAEATGAGDPAAAAAPGEQRQGGSMKWTILQMAGMYFGMQFLMKQFLPQKQQTTTTTKDASGNVVQVPANTAEIPPYLLRPQQLDEGAQFSPIPQRLAPIWPEDSKVDIIITVSPSVVPASWHDGPSDPVVFNEKDFGIGNWKDKRAIDTTIKVPKQVQNNGTLWGHFYIGLKGSNMDPTSSGFDPSQAVYFGYPLTHYIPKKKVAKTRNLLESKNATEAEEVEKQEEEKPTGPIIASYYHPNTSLSFIPNTGVINFAETAPAVRQFLHLEPTGARDGTGQNTWYYPILYVNTFWQLRTHMTLLNDTVTELPLHIDLNNMAEWKFKTLASVDASARETARQAAFGNPLPGGGDGTEIEMIKEIFLDTNPYLLGVTAFATIAHLILETLAFGSDIAHYRKKKDNVGISVRSILANVFMQTVIFLYLMDNSQNTSWMILGQQAIGILIELWKVTTVVNIRLRPAPPGSLIPYYVSFEDKHKLSETEEKTKEYDEIAFKYMYIAGVPLLIAYAIYSLYYDTHKSWYSYVITTLVGSVYAYGFLMMVPSLYINYRLKSIAHMPAKAMGYKFLNTFIDDLFAFTIKMPFLHRLATFRDDIIFFIYLYQRWAYKIDYTRVNEFGQGGEDDVVVEVKDAEKKEGVAIEPKKVGGSGQKASGASAGTGATKRK